MNHYKTLYLALGLALGALIAGRNHHSVGSGVISELSTGYPGYNSVIGIENATIGDILKENGLLTGPAREFTSKRKSIHP